MSQGLDEDEADRAFRDLRYDASSLALSISYYLEAVDDADYNYQHMSHLESIHNDLRAICFRLKPFGFDTRIAEDASNIT